MASKMGSRELGIAYSKSVWRIFTAIVFCQIAGGAIGTALPLHHNAIVNAWAGGAFGSFPGFILGIAWQHRSTKYKRYWIQTACLLGVGTAIVSTVALLFVYPLMWEEMRRLAEIRQLQGEDLKVINVFDRHGRIRIAHMEDNDSLAAFAEGISDAEGHLPNHPRYSDSWYIVAEGTRLHRFELHIDTCFPEHVIGTFVGDPGSRTSFIGSFKSRGLRPWVEAELVGRNATHDPVVD